jgi:hypothetical protein
VQDDSAADWLLGGAGQDLFFAGQQDTVLDLGRGEIVEWAR